jgi:hypothetical protein
MYFLVGRLGGILYDPEGLPRLVEQAQMVPIISVLLVASSYHVGVVQLFDLVTTRRMALEERSALVGG